MIDRPHLEIDRLEAAEGAFGGRELFVGGDRRGLIERRFGDSGAHHIDAVECRFGVDFGGVARKGDTALLPWPRSGFLARGTRAAMAASFFSVATSRSSRLRALVRQQRIAAGDE